MIKKKKKKKKKKKHEIWAKLLALYLPPPTFYQKSSYVPAALTGHHTPCPPPPAFLHGNTPHPPWEPGPRSGYFQGKHPSSCRAPLALSRWQPFPPPGVPGRTLLRNKRQPPPVPPSRPRPVPRSPPYHICRRRLHPLSPVRHGFRHSGHHLPTRHCHQPALRACQGECHPEGENPRHLLRPRPRGGLT